MSAPLLLAGMHRSGTSLVASWLARAGVDLGRDLLPADAGNPTGYFEALSFLDLDRRMLLAATPEEPGHRDWGWTESGRSTAPASPSMRSPPARSSPPTPPGRSRASGALRTRAPPSSSTSGA